MKNVLMLCFAVSLIGQGFAKENDGEMIYSTGKVIDDRFYPNLESIYINQSSIYVNFENCMYQVQGLLSDQDGVYAERIVIADSWKCVKGHPNPPWVSQCLTCKRNGPETKHPSKK